MFTQTSVIQLVSLWAFASLTKRHQEQVHVATLAQIGWETDLLNVLREEPFSCPRRLDVLKCCPIQTRAVHTPNNSTEPSVVPPLMSKIRTSPILFPFRRGPFPFGTRQIYTKYQIGNRCVFRFGSDQAPGYGDALVFANTFAASVLLFQVLLYRDWTCAVRGHRVPHKSTVNKRPLERTVSCDSVEQLSCVRISSRFSATVSEFGYHRAENDCS